MDRRISALIIAALVVVPLIAVSIPVVPIIDRVEAQASSVVVSSLFKNATLIVKIVDTSTVTNRTYYLAAILRGNEVLFEFLIYELNTLYYLFSGPVTTAYDQDTGAYAGTFWLNISNWRAWFSSGVVLNETYEINAVFYNYTDIIMMKVISYNPSYVLEAETPLLKYATLMLTHQYGTTIYGFAAMLLPDGRAAFEIYDLTYIGVTKSLVSAAVTLSLDIFSGAYAATLCFDPPIAAFARSGKYDCGGMPYKALLRVYDTLNVLDLYYNGELVNSTFWGIAAVKTEYVTQTITNTVTTTTNVATTVINLVPVTQTSYVTETVTVPRTIITTETSIMLVLFMLLLFALGIVLYYLMKRG